MASPAAHSVPNSGDPRIDGLVQGGSWQFTREPLLTYSFNYTGFETTQWTADGKAAVAEALAAWSSVANIQFQEVASGYYSWDSTADIAFGLTGYYQQTNVGSAGAAVFPDPSVGDLIIAELGFTRSSYPKPEGDVFLDEAYPGFAYVQPGGYGFAVGLHEIGHALGLKHPHDDGLNGRPTFEELGIAAYDDGYWTVMSYNDPPSPSFAYGYQATPMPLDILAIQHIYGANTSYHTGDDVYQLYDDGIVKTIWDAGGSDTLSAASLAFGVSLDLREGAFIEHGFKGSTTAIAFGTVIENAIGSAYADSLTGNDSANVFDGGGGADLITGLGGIDYALYVGNRVQYSVSHADASYMVIDNLGAAGMDSLDSIERLQFADRNIALDINGANSAGGIYRLYQAAFDRTPDLGGLGYWIDRADHGHSAVAMAIDFTWSAEFQQLFQTTTQGNYGEGADIPSLVDGFYQHVLHRTPDQGGLDFYTATIVDHDKTVGQVLAEISDSPENYAQVTGQIQDGIDYDPWLSG